MVQIFHRSFNVVARLSIFGTLFFIIALGWVGARVVRSPVGTNAYVAVEQPVPFSHRHHAGELGIDCRYCHTGAETRADAGLPPTHTCMTCHSQLWTDAPALAPVRQSYATGKPLVWN